MSVDHHISGTLDYELVGPNTLALDTAPDGPVRVWVHRAGDGRWHEADVDGCTAVVESADLEAAEYVQPVEDPR